MKNESKNWGKFLRDSGSFNKQLKRELRRKDKALAETAALLALRKKMHAIWGGQGRMIGALDRKRAVKLIGETVDAGPVRPRPARKWVSRCARISAGLEKAR